MNLQASLDLHLSGTVSDVLVLTVAAALAFTSTAPIALLPLVGRFKKSSTWVQRSLLLGGVLSASLVALLGDGHVAARLSLPGFALPHSVSLGVELDRLSTLMLTLTGFLGMVVVGFSHTYLRNEKKRFAFLRRLIGTISLVQAFLLSTSLAGHALIWLAISWNVHRLLRHYDERPRARLAARKKFLTSRLGDLCLYAALTLLFTQYQTLDLRELFAAAQAPGEWNTGHNVAMVLMVGAALLKSAQFPFHSWLPETMDAPTPVSALMHAGVVNAGAYLLLELTPLLSRSPAAMLLLVVVGATSAAAGTLMGALQPSRKLSLAYSTVAQMGFLFFELGLGFAGAALLHLVAHGVYKAHAFLRSGTPSTFKAYPPPGARKALYSVVASVCLSGSLMYALEYWFGWFGEHFIALLPLSAVWSVAMSQYLSGPTHLALAYRVRSYFLVCGCVWALTWLAEKHCSSFLTELPTPLSGGLIASTVVGGSVFILATALVLCAVRRWNGPTLTPLYVHLLSGLYIGEWTDWITELVWSDRKVPSVPRPTRAFAQPET